MRSGRKYLRLSNYSFAQTGKNITPAVLTIFGSRSNNIPYQEVIFLIQRIHSDFTARRKPLKHRGFIILWILCCLAVPAPCRALAAESGDAPALDAVSAILVASDSGEILYEKNPRQRLYPASVTKLMTLLLGVEAIQKGMIHWDDPITASERAASYGGSQIYLAPGEILSCREIMLGVALASGNDAAVALAEHVAGSHEAFVDMMNQRARALGMTETHFVNANGLQNEDHYTTAYDLSLLAREAAKSPELLELTSLKHYTLRADAKRPFQLDNKNKLLWQTPGVDGFKTGWTQDAGYCLAATGKRDNLRLISVVMDNPKPQGHLADSKKLLEWGFGQFAFEPLFQPEAIVTQVPVSKGMRYLVPVQTPALIGYTAPKRGQREISVTWALPEILPAPIEKHQALGFCLLKENGAEIARYPLYAAETVEKESLAHGLMKLFAHFI
jgi:D-alanyl-D-alanine carboxypeptidase (penicillin-binding protein 5/6)